MIHIIIFSIVALAIFVLTFLKLIKENNSNYVFALIPEFIGICIDFIYMFNGINPNTFVIILMYVLSIFIPIIIIILKKNDINILECINIIKVYYYEKKNRKEDAKKVLIKTVKINPSSYTSHKQNGMRKTMN